MTRRKIRFVDRVAPGDAVVMTFSDPATRFAVLAGLGEAAGEPLEIDLLGPGGASLPAASGVEDARRVLVRYRGVEVSWRPGYASVLCEAEQAEALIAAIVEFAYFEGELRRIEDEIAATWGELEEDKGLAFEVTPVSLKRSEEVGRRMGLVFGRRIRCARIEPRLYLPGPGLSAPGQKLGEELREKADIEARLEMVDGQLEVFEHVYEMSGQRMGEFRASRGEHILEWVIIMLLAVETLVMLAGTLRR